MLLKEKGRIIELNIADKVQSDCMKSVGMRAGIFPDEIHVVRRDENDEKEIVTYVRKEPA